MNEGLDVTQVKEHDTVFIKNPTAEDFTQRFKSDPYTVKAGEEKAFSKFVAFHIAHHLSTNMIVREKEKDITPEDARNQGASIHLKIAQLGLYDTPERRIALYKILGRKELVEEVVKSYPFKGFIGEMALYERFVAEAETPKEPIVAQPVSPRPWERPQTTGGGAMPVS